MIDVSIIVVSRDDAADLPVSLASALAQTGASTETLLVDNASTDASREVPARLGGDIRVLALPENVGFAAAMNAGIEASSGRFVLALNPDCRLDPDFCSVLVERQSIGRRPKLDTGVPVRLRSVALLGSVAEWTLTPPDRRTGHSAP